MVHVKPKRPLTPVPYLQSIVNEIISADDERATIKILEKFDAPHRFERPDERNLINWYKVLNRFDQLLERYVADRNIFAKSSKLASSEPQKSVDRSKSPSRSRSAPLQANNVSRQDSVSRRASAIEPSAASAVDEKPVLESGLLKGGFTPSPILVRLILRVTHRLIRNASHDTRYIYNSVEHLCALLADDNSAIVFLTLEILNMLLQRSPKLRAARVPVSPELTDRLLDLAVGWGGRENGLGMLECCSSNSVDTLPADGNRVFFKYTRTSSTASTAHSDHDVGHRDQVQAQSDIPGRRGPLTGASFSARGPTSSPLPLPPLSAFNFFAPSDEPVVSTSGASSTIIIEDAGTFKGEERWLLSDFAARHAIPKNKLFSLLSALRRARRFSEGREGRIEAVIIRLYAITTLFNMQPLPFMLQDLLSKEPEMLHDIVALTRAEGNDGVQDIPRSLRIIAIRCLTAMSSDRHRVASIMSATGVNLHHGALPTLLRTEIAALLSSSSEMKSDDADDGSEQMGCDEEEASGGGDHDLSMSNGVPTDLDMSLIVECSRVPSIVQRIQTTESLLGLVYSLAMAAGSSGATPLANSGVLGILIPLLNDRDIRHARVVAQAIRAMQGIIEGSAQTVGSQHFRDQDGLSLVAERIAVEVGIESTEVPETERNKMDEAVEVEALRRRGETRAFYERLGRRQMTPPEALEHQPPSSSSTSRGQLPHSKWALLRALHQLLLVALGTGGNEVRALVVESKLPKALRKIMAQPFLHGGSLFQSAATVTTDIAHAEPTATAELVKAGLATTVLRSIELGLPPCGEAVRCVPNLLAALCLAPAARDIIVSKRPLKQYLLRLATPFYTRALHGDIPVYIGSALDELMRHVEALRPNGNEAMIEYLSMSAKFVEANTREFERVTKPTEGRHKITDTDMEPESVAHRPVDPSFRGLDVSAVPEGDGEKVSADEVLLQKMKLAVANNSCRLAGFAQGSSEHQEGIVKGGGLDHMINLRIAPALASPEASVRDGYLYSRHYPTPAMTVVSLVTSLRNFSSRHGTAVLKSLFSVILKDAATVLKLASHLHDAWLPEEEKDYDYRKPEPDGRDGSKSSKLETSKGNGVELQVTASLEASDPLSIRASLSRAIRKLRVDVVLLSGLSRGGPGSSTGAWESAGGSQVASVISTVERAARYHLAVVYTGLTLSASSDGDLSTATVTATANPALKSLQPNHAAQLLGEVNRVIGYPVTKNKAFEEACKHFELPPEGSDAVRQDVKGLAWHLVTFVVAAQRLYSTLARSLTFSSRRPSRDPARYAASAKSLAGTIGRIFALHLKAAAPLWERKVVTMGNGQVVAAWDFVRGIVIEIKGTLFDENRRSTQSQILKAFLEAGGAEALVQAAKPLLLVRAASTASPAPSASSKNVQSGETLGQKFEGMLRDKSLSIGSSLLALHDAIVQLKLTRRVESAKRNSPVDSGEDDTAMSTDSVSNQARAISRIVVSDSIPGLDNLPAFAGEGIRMMLSDKGFLESLRDQTSAMSAALLKYCSDVSVRRVASDVWNTLCGFLHLLASCPGLSTPQGSSDTPRPTGEWTPQDIQRSALSVSVDILASVTEHPADLLSAFRPDGSAMTDILGVVHSASQVAEEVAKKTETQEHVAGTSGDGDGYPEPQQEPTSAPTSPDPEVLRRLTEMGFSERRIRMALRRTARRGIESAMDWLLANPEEEDDSGDSQDDPSDVPDGEQNEQEDEDGAEDATHGDSPDEDEDVEEAGSHPDGAREGENDENSDSGRESQERTPSAEASDDQIMIDAAEADEPIRHTAQGRDSQLSQGEGNGTNEPSGPSSVAGMTDGDARAKKSAPKRGSALAMERDGSELLGQSAAVDLTLLRSALQRSQAVKQHEISELLRMAAARILHQSHGDETEVSADSSSVSSISVDFFKGKKAALFKSLLGVTREFIGRTDTHAHGAHLPYIAVELLSIMQRDGAMPEEESSSFATLLTDGLKLALERSEDGTGDVKANPRSYSTALWAHYGGNRSRRALRSSGAFRLAYDRLMNCVAEWERLAKSPTAGSKEAKSAQDEKLPRSLDVSKADSAEKVVPRLESKSLPGRGQPLRSPSKYEASMLKQVSTCILLLDADVRYEFKDKMIQRAKMPVLSKKDGKMDAAEDGEKMDTDDGSVDVPEASDADNDRQNSGSANQTQSMFEEHMREIFGPTSSAMDVDEKPEDGEKEPDDDGSGAHPRHEDVDLDAAKAAAADKKVAATNALKKTISEWLSGEVDRGGSFDMVVPRDSVLRCCLRLLRLWRALEVGDAVLAILQLLAALTQEWTSASTAIENGAVDLLLGLPQLDGKGISSTDTNAVRVLVKTILRQLIEDPETLAEAMSSEIRSLAKSRPSFTMKTLIAATAPMVARDLHAFIAAVSRTVKACENSRNSHVQLQSHKQASTAEMRAALQERMHVAEVIRGLSHLLVVQQGRDDGPKGTSLLTSKLQGLELPLYALETLAELTEVSQVAAVAFIETSSPSTLIHGSALDFVFQTLLPLSSVSPGVGTLPLRLGSTSSEVDEVASAVRKLFVALCSPAANAHDEAVAALARAAELEATKDEVSPGVIRGIANCVAPGIKLRVLRAILHSGLSNDLARSLGRLDLSVEPNFEVALSVLRALALIGQAATHMSRHGDSTGEDVSFGTGGRDTWLSIRDREDAIAHSPSYMVL